MTITQIKCFLTAARCLNFSKAADQLDTSQPNLSRQIAGMESELNLILFIRDGRRLHLTPAGQALANTLSSVYQNYTTAVEQAQNIQRGISGSLNIGILHGTYVADFMLDITRFFQEKHPEVELSFSYDSFHELQNKLYNNQLDIAFTTLFSVVEKEYLLYNYVEHSVDYILMHRDHPLARRDSLTLKDCRNETFILISPEDCPESSTYIIQACHDNGFYPRIIYAPTLYDLMLNVETGRGITILDTRNMLRLNPYIKSFPLKQSLWDPSLAAVWNQSNYNPVIPVFMSRLNKFAHFRE